MKVSTLAPEAFAEACLQLERLTLDFDPDLVVGIATGGEFVARRMYPQVKHLAVVARRPSSSMKDRREWLWRVVHALPLWIRNGLRILEAHLLKSRKAPIELLTLDETTRTALATGKRILIVDDAIDSGATMMRVIAAVREAAPLATIATAVITVTTKRPLLEADYRLFSDRRLVRFPWSKDFTCQK